MDVWMRGISIWNWYYRNIGKKLREMPGIDNGQKLSENLIGE